MSRFRFFAVAPRGLEPLLADELRSLGAAEPQADAGGVWFEGDLKLAYAANLHSRLASRILWQVARVPYRREDDLYAGAMGARWEDFFDPQRSLRLDITARASPLRSLEFALLRVKDGIVDRLRDKTGTRPNIDRTRPDVRVFIFLDERHMTLSLDLSGESLFKRGWRADKGEAPLKENLAAGLLKLAGWTPAQPLVDPFCGSGTIVIEAATIAQNRAPGLSRRFGFERLRTFEPGVWKALKDEAQAAVVDNAPMQIEGSDISTRVIEVANENATMAGLKNVLADGRLRLFARDARQAEPIAGTSAGVLIANPPYGEQSAPKSATVPRLMTDFGNRLKQQFAGWDAWLLTSDRGLPGQMRLKETRKTVLFNGPLECRFFRFQVVAGSYRKPSTT